MPLFIRVPIERRDSHVCLTLAFQTKVRLSGVNQPCPLVMQLLLGQEWLPQLLLLLDFRSPVQVLPPGYSRQGSAPCAAQEGIPPASRSSSGRGAGLLSPP